MPLWPKLEKGIRRLRGLTCALVLMLALSPRASAHNGPPFPIIVDQRVGPCVVSLWTHPDVGINSPFYVLVEAPPGGTIPSDLKFQLAIQPVNGRIPEAIFNMAPQKLRGQVEFGTEVMFDRQEFWRVRLIVQSASGNGEAAAQVEATPPGYGQWDLLLYMLPFLGIGWLWFTAVAKRRALKKRQLQQDVAGVP